LTVAHSVQTYVAELDLRASRRRSHGSADADSVLRTQRSVVLSTLLERPFVFGAG
jgi:hypothetical protein